MEQIPPSTESITQEYTHTHTNQDKVLHKMCYFSSKQSENQICLYTYPTVVCIQLIQTRHPKLQNQTFLFQALKKRLATLIPEF